MEPPIDYAYRMGRDCAINGPNETNCDFRIFATPVCTDAWERGKASYAPSTAGPDDGQSGG